MNYQNCAEYFGDDDDVDYICGRGILRNVTISVFIPKCDGSRNNLYIIVDVPVYNNLYYYIPVLICWDIKLDSLGK